MNVFGIGTDMVAIERLAKKLKKNAFVELIFTSAEIEYCRSRKYSHESFAARFAAKEAYMKAIGSGWSKRANFREIEVQHTPDSQPKIVLYGETKSYFEKSNLKEIFVSLTHTSSTAMAFIIITK